MMTKYFQLILKNKVTIVVLFALLLSWSLVSLPSLNVSAVPDVTNKQVMINTRTGAYSTEQIEKIVSYPIETEMLGLPHVLEVRSLSKYGLSQVIVVFEDSVDIYFARQLVTEKLQKVSSELPDGMNPELGPVSSGLGEIFMWTLDLNEESPFSKEPRKEQLRYLKRLQDYVVAPKIKKIQGVAEVDTNGGFATEVHINYEPKKLTRIGLDMESLVEAIDDVGVYHGGSYIKDQGEQVVVRSGLQTDNLEDFENIVIKVLPSGQKIRVKDIGTVRLENQPRVGGATHNGKETVLGTVLMRIGSNSRRVSTHVREALDSMSLPKGVALEVVYDRKTLVDKTIMTVAENLLEGALLVILVLFLILGNFRASLIVALAIPFSMGIAFKGMQLFGISANLMSLGAIDFGLLVDASVVLVENFLRHMHQQSGFVSNEVKKRILLQSCVEVAKPVIFGLIIIMIVYIPILALEGVEGKMFRPMALTVLMALGVSLAIALFITPVLLYFFIPTKVKEEKVPFLFRWIRASYLPVFNFVLRFPKSTASGAFLIFTISLFLFLQIGSDFVPQLDEGDLVIGLVRDSRQNIDKSIEEQQKVEKIITQFDEVDYVFSRIGTPESATDPMSPNFADTFVILNKEKTKWPIVNGHRRSKSELFAAIKKKLEEEIEGQDISATQPIEMRFNEILEGSRADVTLRFIGADLDELLKVAKSSESLLQGIDGIQSLEFDALTGLTKSRVMDISLDSEQIQMLGLNVLGVNRQIEMALAGHEIGYHFIDGVKFPVVFHLTESLRDDIDVLQGLPISLPQGGVIPLENVATFTMKEKVTTIARRWAERYSAISIYVSGRDIGSLVQEAKDRLEKNLSLPEGYQMEWGGQFRNLERARAKLMVILPLVLGIIFFLILAMTRSIQLTTIIFTAVPLGLAGGVFTLFIRNMNFSVSAAVGFIALSGIVILNSLVLVSHIQELKKGTLTTLQAIKEGALSRLRPVCMTALVASLGFLPMAFNTGAGAEVQRPLATVVIGGLFTSTVLTMLVVPCLMVIFSNTRKNQN